MKNRGKFFQRDGAVLVIGMGWIAAPDQPDGRFFPCEKPGHAGRIRQRERREKIPKIGSIRAKPSGKIHERRYEIYGRQGRVEAEPFIDPFDGCQEGRERRLYEAEDSAGPGPFQQRQESGELDRVAVALFTMDEDRAALQRFSLPDWSVNARWCDGPCGEPGAKPVPSRAILSQKKVAKTRIPPCDAKVRGHILGMVQMREGRCRITAVAQGAGKIDLGFEKIWVKGEGGAIGRRGGGECPRHEARIAARYVKDWILPTGCGDRLQERGGGDGIVLINEQGCAGYEESPVVGGEAACRVEAARRHFQLALSMEENTQIMVGAGEGRGKADGFAMTLFGAFRIPRNSIDFAKSGAEIGIFRGRLNGRFQQGGGKVGAALIQSHETQQIEGVGVIRGEVQDLLAQTMGGGEIALAIGCICRRETIGIFTVAGGGGFRAGHEAVWSGAETVAGARARADGSWIPLTANKC